MIAAKLAGKGFAVFPIKAGAKFPPLWKDWPNRSSTTIAPADWPDVCNVGVHCAGMIVLDFDTKKGGLDSYARLDILEGLPATLTARTPSGGKHLFYRLPVDHPGVPNSVSLLAPGVDVRSAGGYVVAAGSSTDAGAYVWEDEAAPVAPAPEWLVAKLGAIAPKAGTPVAPVADAPDLVLTGARTWLDAQDGAVEGEGGDARTYAVACGLRDRGCSEAQAIDLLLGWNERCSPPWPAADLRAKVRNAFKYAQNEPAARTAIPADFPVVDASPPPAGPRPAALRLSEFAKSEHRGAGYVVKGMLQKRSYAVLYGAPGEGKTFAVLDLAYHVAAGKDWMGHKVHQGAVLYLPFEGTGGMVKRALALRQRYGDEDVPFFVAGAAFNLRELPGRAALGEILATLPEKPVLIVIDTFARALMGGDENSAQDVGAFNSAIAALIESTGACVAIVHHSGKDKSKGARGSSAILGAIDTEIEVDGGRIEATKQRDMELAPPLGFKLVPVVVGIDDDGDELTSCVLEPAQSSEGRKAPLSGNPQRGFDVLCEGWPDNSPASIAEWRDACKSFLGERGVAQRFHDIKKTLVARGYVVVDDNGKVTRAMQ